jgi:hypothetical protein
MPLPGRLYLSSLVNMDRLNSKKLHVKYLTGTTPENLILPRLYTLTHSDRTGDLFLTIGSQYDKQISKLYTRLMRDEVLAELTNDRDGQVFKVYCHVSGGLIVGTAKWRYKIFHTELPLVLEAIRYGDRTLFELNPQLDHSHVFVHFQSIDTRFNRIEDWGFMEKYR